MMHHPRKILKRYFPFRQFTQTHVFFPPLCWQNFASLNPPLSRSLSISTAINSVIRSEPPPTLDGANEASRDWTLCVNKELPCHRGSIPLMAATWRQRQMMESDNDVTTTQASLTPTWLKQEEKYTTKNLHASVSAFPSNMSRRIWNIFNNNEPDLNKTYRRTFILDRLRNILFLKLHFTHTKKNNKDFFLPVCFPRCHQRKVRQASVGDSAAHPGLFWT